MLSDQPAQFLLQSECRSAYPLFPWNRKEFAMRWRYWWAARSFLCTAAPRPSTCQRRLLVEQLECRSLLATLPQGFTETAIATGLNNATAMELAPNGDLWVLEQGGDVKRFRPGSTAADVVGDISTLGLSSVGERGVLGIAFD